MASRNPFVNQVFVVGKMTITGDYQMTMDRRNPFVNQVFVVASARRRGI